MGTIAAISTPPGNGGIGIIRLSGDNCFEILNKIFIPKNKNNKIKGYSIKYGNIVSPKGKNIIDEVLVSYFIAPKSYTTENMCEINSHGGTIITKKILELCIENGAELAEPGEFTKRAFLNGRIDLSQAEAVIDIINSKTEKEAKESLKQLKGNLAEKINEIKNDIMQIMVQIEASIDYPEYDVEEVTNTTAIAILKDIKNKLNNLEKTFENGKILKEGIKVAIIGKPNVGKSSLLNNILKEERAIVTDLEGTTRDTIEELISIKGIPIKIIDTAGIRDTQNKVEKIGIDKAKTIAEEADLIIAIFDASKELDDEDKQILKLIKNKTSIVVLNKIDKGNILKESQEINKINYIEISVKNNYGIEDIYDRIVKLFEIGKIESNNDVVITNLRHKKLISKSKENIEEAIDTINNKMPIDIIQINIKNAWEALGEITGETVSENIIKEIFNKFCLGK